jgi:hypothetical protein
MLREKNSGDDFRMSMFHLLNASHSPRPLFHPVPTASPIFNRNAQHTINRQQLKTNPTIEENTPQTAS